jgi:parallel beta-helix repeat protein
LRFLSRAAALFGEQRQEDNVTSRRGVQGKLLDTLVIQQPMRGKTPRTATAVESLEGRRLLAATIVGRYVFYGNSVFDTGTSIAAAIAPDKTALLPGHASSFANYTSYSRGIDGLAIDAVNWPAVPVAGDFVLRAGNNSTPSSWSAVTQPVTYSIQHGAGTGGSDRIILRLPDGAVRNQWLQVTVNPTADTGLSSPDVFYFGNSPGDDGHNLTNAVVDASDVAGARADAHGFLSPAPITDLYDFNRDGRVDATDQLIARNSINTSATALQMFTAPAAADPGTTGPFTGIFNVKLFGAKGDGVSDDAAAIQSAINAMLAAPPGGLLYFPSGTYRISTFLSLQNESNFEIRGSMATLMPLDSDPTVNISGDILRLSQCSGFTISGLSFDGDSAKRTQSDQPASVRISGCSDFRIAGCAFDNTLGDGMYLSAVNPADPSTASRDALIEGCSFNSAYRNAISFIHGYRVSIASNLIKNVSGTLPQSGIDIEANPNDNDVANHDLSVCGNQFVNCAGSGVFINQPQHPTNVSVFSDSFVNCPTAVINEGVNSRIDNNQFHDVTNPAGAVAQIYFGTATGQSAEVTGNIFYSVTGMSAVLTAQTWTGATRISANRISGFSVVNAPLISVWSDAATITANNIQANGIAIGVTANTADIENNALTGVGSADGIYTLGFGQAIRGNTISNFVRGVESSEPTTGGSALTAIDSNTISGCPTGVLDSIAHSEINGNTFVAASLPVSGPGSTAVAQIYLSGMTGGAVQINGNSISSLTGLGAVYIHPSWSGQATISNNQISNLSSPSVVAINVQVNNAAILANTLNGVAGMGIGATANAVDVENNSVSDGTTYGIYVQGNQGTVRNNTVTGRPIGIYLVDPVTGANPALVTAASGNTITNCPTGVQVSVSNASIINNTFSAASLPASGPGSNAVAQLYLVGVAGGVAQITGNNFNSLTALPAIYVHSSWTGRATISLNQLTGLTSLASAAINVWADNSVITGNTLQNVSGPGIGVTANGADIENNTIPAGSGDGIFLQGLNGTIRLNNVTAHPVGVEITNPTTGGSATATTTVDSNTVSTCPTAIRDTSTGSSVINNTLSGAVLPPSGPGSDALGQVYLLGVTGGKAMVSGNTFSSLSALAAIYVHSSWSGQATISSNQINGITALAAPAITVWADNSVITGNTLQNVSCPGIGVTASGADIENNTIPAGSGDGIYLQGNNGLLRKNNVTGHTVGIEITNPSTGGSTAATTTVDSNTISNCPTAVQDTTTGSAITNNSISNASLPASGPGSNALAQIYLLGVSNGTANVSGNIMSSITSLEAILVHSSWSGSATISANQISNFTSANGIQVDAANASISSNTLQNIGGTAISVSTSDDLIQNNTLTTGTGTGIYAQGVNHTIKNNTLTDFGIPATGQCIFTAYGGGGTSIVGNTIRKTMPNSAWVPIVINPLDLPGVNYRYGVQGADGAFTPGVGGAASASTSVTPTSGPTNTTSSTPTRHPRSHRR